MRGTVATGMSLLRAGQAAENAGDMRELLGDSWSQGQLADLLAAVAKKCLRYRPGCDMIAQQVVGGEERYGHAG